jgi:dTDP-4-amino-4,6-dideoxygalactose transaminase
MAGTAGAVIATGATPILVDIDPLTGTVDCNSVDDALQANDAIVAPNTLIAVHVNGSVSNVFGIQRMFPNLRIIEDCAQAIFTHAPRTGTLTGVMGNIGVLSFKQGKQVSCGEGGALLVRDEALAAKVALMRNHGEVNSDETVGGNYHMTELQAAVLDARMNRRYNETTLRYSHARMLARRVSTLSHFIPMEVSGPPFIFWCLAHPHIKLPHGFTRTYHTPLCCLPYYKRQLKQSCLVNAHVFAHNMIWCAPPESAADVDSIYNAMVEVDKCASF